MGGSAVPTEKHVTEVYQPLGQPGTDARALAVADDIQQKIRDLRAREMERVISA